MRLLLVHGGAVWATHDVYTGLLAGLRAGGHEVLEYALGGRLDASEEWLRLRWQRQQERDGPLQDVAPSAADVQHHASEGVLAHALRHEPDWVVVVCGAYFHPDIAVCAARAGLRLAVVFTESPYDDAQQGKVAPLYEACFTNERTSVPRLREANPNTHYLPMGYDPATHGPSVASVWPGPPALQGQPEDPVDEGGEGREDEHPHDQLHHNGRVDQHAASVPVHDVVFVGTGFDSRVALLSEVDWSGIDLGLYGVWDEVGEGHPLAPHLNPRLVDNAEAGALYRAARIGLNLYRATGGPPAESLNPRAYELAADGVFTVAQPRAEQTERLGGSVATFTTPGELEERIRTHLADAWRRRRTAEALPALVREDTYHHRAAQLVAHLQASGAVG